MANFKKIRSVTQSVLKLENGQARYVFVLAPMHMGEKIDSDKDEAILLPVVDMETGEEGIVIAPSILQNELVKSYGATGYVAKAFEIVKSRPDMKVKYNHVSICEVAPKDDFTPPAAPVPNPAMIKAAFDKISADIDRKAFKIGDEKGGKVKPAK